MPLESGWPPLLRSQSNALVVFVGKITRSLIGIATVDDMHCITVLINCVTTVVHSQAMAINVGFRLLNTSVNHRIADLDSLQQDSSSFVG